MYVYIPNDNYCTILVISYLIYKVYNYVKQHLQINCRHTATQSTTYKSNSISLFIIIVSQLS